MKVFILGFEMDSFSLLNCAIYSLRDSLFPYLMMFKCCEFCSGFLLLENYSMNVSINWASEQIKLLGKFVYHCKVGPIGLSQILCTCMLPLDPRGWQL